MNKKGWCRPKQGIVYSIGIRPRCWIGCLPQQRWEFRYEPDGDVTILSEKKRIWFQITAEDFEQNWREVKTK